MKCEITAEIGDEITVGTSIDSKELMERERCLNIVKDFQFVYEGRKVDGYSKGRYMMVDPEASRKKLLELIRNVSEATEVSEDLPES